MSITVTNYGVAQELAVESVSELETVMTANGYGTATGKDIRLLIPMLKAAREAEEGDFCYQYDRIAEAIGTWTRDELRDAGLLTSTFTVRGTRTVTMTVSVPWSTSVEATRPADIRNGNVDLDIDVEAYEIRNAISEGNYEIEDTDDDIDEIERD